MSETKTELTHTVFFGRKKSDGNYGSEEASFFIQFNTPLDAAIEDIIEAAVPRFVAAKAATFDQLGIPYELMDNAIAEIETVAAASLAPKVAGTFAPASVAAAPAPAASEPVNGNSVPALPPFDAETEVKEEKSANYRWAKERYAVAPNEFWDNRQNKLPESQGGKGWSAKGPDIKHKDSQVVGWLS